jgi:uncharacterized protein (DUF1697 family)
MNTFVILLRGITPTGKNKVLMAPLRAALKIEGLKDEKGSSLHLTINKKLIYIR